jgi:predicted amidophosphoribosyltransferase
MGVLSLVSNEEIKRRLEGKRRGLSEIQQDEKTGKYKTCPHCKFNNPEKSIFCVKCGKKFETNVSIKCNSCGTINPKTAKFCIKCGNNLTTQESTKNKEEEKTPSLVEDEKTEDESYIDNEPSVESESEVENIQIDIKNQETVTDGDIKSSEVEDKEESEINHIKTLGLPSSIPDQNLINQRNNKKTCKSCEAKNLKSAKFCVVCGEKFEIPPVEKSVKDQESNENNKEDVKSAEIDDPMDKIKKAKELLDIGAITQEEFESIKSKYLGMV